MRNAFTFRLALLAFALLAFSSCKKDDGNVQEFFESAEDNSAAENEFNAIFNFSQEQHESVSGKVARTDTLLPAGATVTVTSLGTDSWHIVIDFGTTNLLCSDGYYRRGKLNLDVKGKFETPGSTIVASTQDYYFNDIKVEGSKKITNISTSTTGNFKFQIEVNNAKVTYTDGKVATWSTNRVNERIAGNSTASIWDDVYLITGSANGINRRGDSYTATITDALKFKASCILSNSSKQCVKGKITFSSGKNTLKFDYDPIGGEPCDKIGSVQWNDGKWTNIALQ